MIMDIFSDFIGNQSGLKLIERIISDKSKGIHIIVGENCSGKSYIYQIMLKSKKLEILYIDETNYNSTMVQNFVTHTTIENMISQKTKLVFIDDINLISSDKTLKNLLMYIKNKISVICTVRTNEEKKIISLKNHFHQRILLHRLTHEDCLKLVLKIVPYTCDEINTIRLKTLIAHMNSNIPKILMLIESCLETDRSVEFTEISENFDKSIYETLKRYFGQKLDGLEINDMIRKDIQLITSMIHENIVQVTSFTNDPKDLKNLKFILNTQSECDIVDRFIYTNCCWDSLNEINNVYRLSSINSRLLGKYTNELSFNFTKQFTKLSSQSSMRKKLSFLDNIYSYDNIFVFLEYIRKKNLSTTIDNKLITDLVKKYEIFICDTS
jgi:hypothetical protein